MVEGLLPIPLRRAGRSRDKGLWIRLRSSGLMRRSLVGIACGSSCAELQTVRGCSSHRWDQAQEIERLGFPFPTSRRFVYFSTRVIVGVTSVLFMNTNLSPEITIAVVP